MLRFFRRYVFTIIKVRNIANVGQGFRRDRFDFRGPFSAAGSILEFEWEETGEGGVALVFFIINYC